jgi:hypothetical protein
MKKPSVLQPLSIEPLPIPLSSRANPDFLLTALTAATYVVLFKENHMQSIEAATLDRKSGEAEGSAVPPTFPGNVFRPKRIVVERSAVYFGPSHLQPPKVLSVTNKISN